MEKYRKVDSEKLEKGEAKIHSIYTEHFKRKTKGMICFESKINLTLWQTLEIFQRHAVLFERKKLYEFGDEGSRIWGPDYVK